MKTRWAITQSCQDAAGNGVSPQPHPVIAGPDPAIHCFGKRFLRSGMDARVKPAHEARWMRGSSPRMTSSGCRRGREGAVSGQDAVSMECGRNPATSLPGLPRQSIASENASCEARWMRGSSPRMTSFGCPAAGGEDAVGDQDAVSMECRRNPVIAGPDPAIHRFGKRASCEAGWMRGSSPRMTSYDEFWMPAAGGERRVRVTPGRLLPFSPCGRRWRAAPDEGSPRARAHAERTPHPAPSRCARFATLSHKGRG
jgi:hypothetical protein